MLENSMSSVDIKYSDHFVFPESIAVYGNLTEESSIRFYLIVSMKVSCIYF